MCLTTPHICLASDTDTTATHPDSLEISLEFPINSCRIYREFRGNDDKIRLLDSIFASGDSLGGNILVISEASPDGPLRYNIELAEKRLNNTRKFLVERYNLMSDSLSLTNGQVPWEAFRSYVAASPLSDREQILRISSTGRDDSPRDVADRMSALKRHDSGRTWQRLKREVLPLFRRSRIITVKIRNDKETDNHAVLPDTIETRHEDTLTIPREIADTMPPATPPDSVISSAPAPPRCSGAWHISTNIPEWAMLISNISGEWDFACRWSARLSLHYSALNYGSEKRKFRTFMLRPEVRWWLRGGHTGFFVDVHAGMAYYNVALKSWKYRVQDAEGKSPALGGGLGIGYRVNLHRHWALEALIGAGLYRVKYDKFANRHNGPYISTHTQLWGGIDNVALSVVYNFNIPAK